jgi:hypothetical protein
VFCTLSPCGDLLDVFLLIRLGLRVWGFGEEDRRGKMPFLSHYIQALWYHHHLSLVLTLTTWWRQ